MLSVLQDSLTNLELINCKSITDQGLRDIKILKYVIYRNIKKINTINIVSDIIVHAFFRNLEMLKIQGLPYLENKDLVREELMKALPNCKIDFP